MDKQYTHHRGLHSDQLPLENASCATRAINGTRVRTTAAGNCIPSCCETQLKGGQGKGHRAQGRPEKRSHGIGGGQNDDG
ncbi:hypothetical protein M0804_003778 [Polistes exclamans]|nr:hypothetical protein M0804_003778 [Polistes exclamans]